MSETLVVIPMKAPHLAKTRLRDVLSQNERARLARQLFERTVHLILSLSADDTGPNFDPMIVTEDAGIKERASNLGVRAIDETGGAGLNGAIEEAAQTAIKAGYKRLCILPADLASPDPRDIRRLLSQELGQRGMAICPSRDFGTNALLVSPPDAVSFAYGSRSFHRHCENAEAVGISPVILPFESLRWDIDSSDDLAELKLVAPEIFRTGGDG